MTQRHVVVLGLLATSLCWAAGAGAQSGSQRGIESDRPQAAPTPTPSNLVERAPMPKRPTWQLSVPENATGRVIIKFRDHVRARAADGMLVSAGGMNLASSHDICEQYELAPAQALRVEDDLLSRLQERAANFSGKAQPDLKGIISVTPRSGDLLEVAQAFNERDDVEWVEIEDRWKLAYGGVDPEACCFPATDTCVDLDPDECASILGLPQGPGSDCATIGVGGCPDTGQCCFPEFDVCIDLEMQDCVDAGGQFRGVGGICADADACDLDCGATMDDCFTEHVDPFCDDEDCCELVCSVDPLCCDADNGGMWDPFCVSLAFAFCDSGDPCAAAFNEACFEPHQTPGCNDAGCCATVCAVEQACCDNVWDENCVAIASSLCNMPDPPAPGVTPDFELLQGYIRTPAYNSLPSTPMPLAAPAPDLIGFTGEGWRLEEPGEAFSDFGRDGIPNTGDRGEGNGWYDFGEAFVDNGIDGVPATMDFGEGNGGWDAPTGLYPLSRELFAVLGIGDTQPPGSDRYNHIKHNTRGKGVKVAVIEWAYYGAEPFTDTNGDGQYSHEPFIDADGDQKYDPGETFSDFGLDGIDGTGDIGEGNGVFSFEPFTDVQPNGTYDFGHEDLDVISEPGQTLIIDPTITEPDHATACLSIINGQENGFGVTGIAPEAQAYFFPLTSVEDGPREQEAFLNCYDTLGPGDVVSCSFGPACSLNNSAFSWVLLRLGADLGIITCVAAGNDCDNVDDCLDLGDSGAIVVGACSPGFPYYRLAFSNHFQSIYIDAADFLSHSNVVHCSAWGLSVASAGYGNIFFPTDPNTGFGDPDRSYTNAFSGTSAATPQIAGLAACYSGLVQQFYGIPLNAVQIREACRVGLTQGRLTIDGSIGGFDESVVPCALDRDPDEGPNQIGFGGVYPRTSGAFGSGSSFILNQDSFGFDESPIVDALTIIRGDVEFGNVFSIKATDGNYLIVDSEYTDRAHRPNLASPINRVQYLASAQMVDMAVIAHPGEPLVSSMTITAIIQSPPVDIIWVIEAYNYDTKEWTFLDLALIPAGGGGGLAGIQTLVPNPNRFVGGKDDRITARATAYSQMFGEGADPFRLHVELLNVETTTQFGGGVVGGGGGGIGGGNGGG